MTKLVLFWIDNLSHHLSNVKSYKTMGYDSFSISRANSVYIDFANEALDVFEL